jgi:uncharacterized protein
MENHRVNITPQQLQELQHVVSLLIDRYQPDKLICFGSLLNCSDVTSCFMQSQHIQKSHYFLLMVTKENLRIEHDVQDFVSTHYSEATVTIISHGKHIIEEAIAKLSRFFITVYRDGVLLYSADGLPAELQQISLPEINLVQTQQKARKHYNYRWNMASGFLEAAEACWEPGYCNTMVFLLHQAVEQTCICLVRVFLAYRADIHNLDRLLKLCLCFYPELANYFPKNTEEEKRLFNLLNSSYSHARYKDDFDASRDDATILLKQVDEFMILADVLCQNRIAEYERAITEAAGRIADHHLTMLEHVAMASTLE